MTTDNPSTVYIVDDDEAVRDSLELLIGTVGWAARSFESADAFLAGYDPEMAGCLLLDVRMPGMSGLELQERLAEKRAMLPIIFITGHGDVEMAVHAMQAGAVDFLQKPFQDEELVQSLRKALDRDLRNREGLVQRQRIGERLELLTPREHEVMQRVVRGQANKVIAIELGVSERTVEIHRSRVMHKMEADSLPHLVRMVLTESE